MGLGKDRTKIASTGLGTVQVAELEPTPGEFADVGYIKNTTVTIDPTMVELVPETGEMVDWLVQRDMVTGTAQLMQSNTDEVGLIKGAASKVYALRYFGTTQPNNGGFFQYHLFPFCKLNPGVALAFTTGERLLPLAWRSIKDVTLAYDVPLHIIAGGVNKMHMASLALWVDAQQLLNTTTTTILDLSGYERHGTLAAAAHWAATSSPYSLLLDGTDDSVSFGDLLDDDALTDYLFEFWLAFPGSNGSVEQVMSKKSALSDHTAGYGMYRHTDNTMIFILSDGDSSANVTSVATFVQNVIKHVAVAIDRNGNMQMYVNGAASGSAASVATQTTGTNAFALFLGREGTTSGPLFGNVRIYQFRIHDYGTGGLPSDVATQVLNHYNAEKAVYGL